jgi:protein phosphatase
VLANDLQRQQRLQAGGLKLSVGAFSTAGAKAENEDSYVVKSPTAKEGLTKGVIALVADGVSHSSQPAKASLFCTTQFEQNYLSSPSSWSTQNAIAQILNKINNGLFIGAERADEESSQATGETTNQTAKKDPIHQYTKHHWQWLSTVSGIVFKSRTAYIFHVGDSQILRIRKGEITTLTFPHHQKLANNTQILTRAMGADSHLKVDFKTESLEQDDVFIFTTDGVHEFIDYSKLPGQVKDSSDLNKLCESLSKQASLNGSQDNLTCVITKVEQVPSPRLDEIQRELFSKNIPPALAAGQTIDQYQVLKVLHATARSHLYLVKNNTNEQVFVLKAPSQNFEEDDIYLQGFIREGWVGSQIVDTRIMRIYPPAEKSPFLYHICEYIEGQTLRQWMLDHPRPSINDVRKIVEQVVVALRLLKRLEIIHRDLKPENLMITSAGEIKLIDFGVASIAALDENINNIKESAPAGTLNYVAPESIESLRYSHQSDLFSIGVITYEMLTGHIPYATPSSSPSATLKKLGLSHHWHYQSALDYRPELPFWLDLALRKSVEPDPKHRYEVCSEFVADITRPNNQAEQAYLNRPLIQRNPVKFWQIISGLLAIGLLFSLLN